MDNTIETLYRGYCEYVRGIVRTGDLSTFKRDPRYTVMLEHVSPALGHQYYDSIARLHGLPDEEILSFCKKNDRIGSPVTFSVQGMSVSPSSLRYIRHALLILSHCVQIGNLTPSFVELGCGYGGLALAIDHYSPMFGINVKSYTMIDLDDPLALQKLYMSNHTVSFPISFESASTYGSRISGTDNFLISNYCFSEVAPHIQQQYLATLFPKCANGFILWNNVKVFDIGKQVRVEPEVPMTTPANTNYHVYF
jgi:hypothetical protein